MREKNVVNHLGASSVAPWICQFVIRGGDCWRDLQHLRGMTIKLQPYLCSQACRWGCVRWKASRQHGFELQCEGDLLSWHYHFFHMHFLPQPLLIKVMDACFPTASGRQPTCNDTPFRDFSFSYSGHFEKILFSCHQAVVYSLVCWNKFFCGWVSFLTNQLRLGKRRWIWQTSSAAIEFHLRTWLAFLSCILEVAHKMIFCDIQLFRTEKFILCQM